MNGWAACDANLTVLEGIGTSQYFTLSVPGLEMNAEMTHNDYIVVSI